MGNKLQQRISERFANPQLTIVERGLNSATVSAMKQSLAMLSPPDLERFLNSDTKVVLGTRDFCKK